MKRVFAILGIVAATSGCARPLALMQPSVRPMAELCRCAAQMLMAQGYDLVQDDPVAGIVSGDRVLDVDRLGPRMDAITVMIAPGQGFSVTGGYYRPISGWTAPKEQTRKEMRELTTACS